jgi:dGTPase
MTEAVGRDRRLRPWASDAQCSRGRLHADSAASALDDNGDAFRLDRDRIVHSTAFRRLVYKTQVFLNHEGDLFRTRLTHSLEVAQLARSIARAMGLNEDLCEAISLAHDLGHTPFGHAGQDALDECLRKVEPDGFGFEHNFQSLRVVDVLEERYPAFDGLNLTFETREGILKHCSRRRAWALESAEPNGVAHRFLDKAQPSLEAQVCNLADEIAYNAHDLDDGIRSGLLVYEQLLNVPWLSNFHTEALAATPRLEGRRLLYEVLRRMVSALVADVVMASDARIEKHAPRDAAAARRCGELIAFDSETSAGVIGVKTFLRRELYRHPQVVRTTEGAKRVVRDLFDAYVAGPKQMTADHARRQPVIGAVADYIAGMTDRFALREHSRLTGAVIGLSQHTSSS